MATDSDILTAVLSRMSSLSTSLPISWPGANFDPPSSGMWFELSDFPNEPENYGWEDDTPNVVLGFFQVLVNFRPAPQSHASGRYLDAVDEAENIIAHFPKGTDLGPAKVSKKPHRSPMVVDQGGSRCFIPVTAHYRGFT